MRRAVLALALLLGTLGAATEARPMPPAVSSDPVIQSATGGHFARLARLIDRCEGDTYRGVRVLLGCDGFWDKQVEVCKSIDQYHTTLVPAGNSVGKSYCGGRIVLSFLLTRRNSIVFTTAPTQKQLNGVLWTQVRDAVAKMPFPLGAEVAGGSPIGLHLGTKWYATGHVSNQVASTTGHHAEHLLLLGDEGSGITEKSYEAGWSLHPSRIVIFGNPLNAYGRFYELCKKAEEQRAIEEKGGPRRTMNLIRIPSTSSPHIDRDRSPWGLADKGFLETNRRDYGEDSIWWLSHVLAQFPDVSAETCIPSEWVRLACQTIHKPGGFRRIAIDCAGGNGGDEWVILCRDDNGVLDLKWSANWQAEEAARIAAEMARTHGVPGFRVSWDKAGLGWDFGNRLAAAGLRDARPYQGNYKAKLDPDLRSACARLARWRLDPGYQVLTPGGVYVPQVPFSFGPSHPEWHPKLAEISLFLRYLKGGTYALEDGGDIRERLKRSPDTGDAFFQSYAYAD